MTKKIVILMCLVRKPAVTATRGAAAPRAAAPRVINLAKKILELAVRWYADGNGMHLMPGQATAAEAVHG